MSMVIRCARETNQMHLYIILKNELHGDKINLYFIQVMYVAYT